MIKGVELLPPHAHIKPDNPCMAVGPVEGVILDKIVALAIGVGCVMAAKLRPLRVANLCCLGQVIPEKKQSGKRHWVGQEDQQQAIYANRRACQISLNWPKKQALL